VDRLFLEPREHVAVYPHGDRRIGVAEPFTHDPRVDPRLQELGRVGVAKVVKPQVGEP
jgi:hypothetical protein